MTVIETIREKHRRTWWTLIVRGILALTVGILILARPWDSLAVLAWVVAIWALVSGVAEIVQSFQLKAVFGSSWILLLAGLVGVVFGIAALYDYPALSLAFMDVWFSLWLITTGVLGIYSSLHLKRSGLPWGWTCTWGALGVLASSIAFISPPATLTVILALLAAFALVSGAALLVAAWRVRLIARHLAVVHPTDVSAG
jgi:uncharacterized membrane protein HdeD (DUF308 family)